MNASPTVERCVPDVGAVFILAALTAVPSASTFSMPTIGAHALRGRTAQ